MKNFESNMDKLSSIVNRLENQSLSIDDSLALYNDAVKLAKLCIDDIQKSKGKLELLTEDLQKINIEKEWNGE